MNIARLNINVRGKVSAGYSGSENVFNEVASYTCGALPLSYIEFIKAADGGHPELGSFVPKNGEKENVFDVDIFYSFENQQVTKVQRVIDQWRPTLGTYAFPIGRDGGGNQLYMDLCNGGSSVWLYLHDESGRRLKIADSFEDFIASLHANHDFI